MADFTFAERQKNLLLKDWSEAELGIWICQYKFNDRKLADKLLEKYRDGLTVMLILEDCDHNRALQESHWEKMPCSTWWFFRSDIGEVQNQKFCIIDGQILWQGSFDFMWSTANNNQEECTRYSNPEKIREFAAKFTSLRRNIDKEERIRRQMSPLS